MTRAEERANELIGKFRYMLLPFITYQTQLTEADLLQKCKQCASFCVNEILEGILPFDNLNKMFYEEVLKNINK